MAERVVWWRCDRTTSIEVGSIRTLLCKRSQDKITSYLFLFRRPADPQRSNKLWSAKKACEDGKALTTDRRTTVDAAIESEGEEKVFPFRHPAASFACGSPISWCSTMATYRRLPLLLVSVLSFCTMRSFAYILPGLLTSQPANAAPAFISPDYDVSNTLLDPEHNKLGAVASESSICSNIGIDALKQGGNAADSLVATTFCVGVIGMYHSGIHGGGFMLVRSNNGSYEFIDFRESAPAAATEVRYWADSLLSNA